MAEGVLLVIAYVLAILTAWDVARASMQRPSTYRAETLLVLAILIGILLAGSSTRAIAIDHPLVGSVLALLFLSQPYLLLRLVHRFHAVPWLLRAAAAAIAVAGGAAFRVLGPPTPIVAAVVAGHFIVMLSYAAWACGREATQASGIAAARLRLVAAGTWIHVCVAALYGLAPFSIPVTDALPSLTRVLGVTLFGCYYAGLVGPRSLKASWARRALYPYFRDAPAIARGSSEARAAEVARVAGQCVSSVARAVFLFPPDGGHTLNLVAIDGAAGIERTLDRAASVVARALDGGRPFRVPPAQCGPELSAWACGLGADVLIVPIRGAERPWGVLVVVQARGLLFPQDDLDQLSPLCAHLGATSDQVLEDGASHDVERNAFEERLRRVQRMEALGHLASGIAHDFRNLLTAAEGYVLSLETYAKSDPMFPEAIAGIRNVVRRAADLASHMVVFGREPSARPQSINLGEVVSDLLPLLARVINPDVELIVSVGSAPVTIFADPIQIEQILLNLAVNARDAMPEGGRLLIDVATEDFVEPRSLSTAVLESGRYGRLGVVDTGTGMDETTRARIFETFFTTKPPTQGTGLGLSTVHGIVSTLGGGIEVNSAPGHGATFEVFLPIVSSNAAGVMADAVRLQA